MKNRLFITVVIMLLNTLHNTMLAQNLVPNYSFEQYSGCPTCQGQLYRATPWCNPNGLTSPDYFNICSIVSCAYPVDIPGNWVGYQGAKTGAAYAGIGVGNTTPFSTREYLAVKLTDSLQSGFKYYISFYVSLSDSANYATSDIGVYIGDSIYYSNGWNPLPYIPQVANPSSNIITDRNNWIQITGEYIAIGGEQYIYIGNFKDNLNTNMLYVPGGSISPQYYIYAYYYVDDVCLSQSPDTCGILLSATIVSYQNNFLIYPNPVKDFLFINNNKYSEIEIYDVFGKNIYQSVIYTHLHKIDLSSYSTGIYYVTIRNKEKNIISKKIILTK